MRMLRWMGGQMKYYYENYFRGCWSAGSEPIEEKMEKLLIK